MVDVVMVSHLGDAAVAAVGFSNRAQFVVLVIMTGLAWGVGILASQFYGAGKTSKIRVSILMGSLLSIALLLPIVIANVYFAGDIVAIGSTDSQVITLGQSYLWITMPSVIFVAISMVYENAIRSTMQVLLPLLVSMVAIITNILLNIWLIDGGLGIPALGVDGAAIATFVSRFLHMFMLIYILVKIRHKASPQLIDFYKLLNWGLWKTIIKLVIPIMLGFAIWAFGSFVYPIIYGRLGTQELAVISLLVPVEGVVVSLFFGIASACSIQVGQRLGAKQFDQAWALAKTFMLFAPCAALVTGLIMFLLKPVIFIAFRDLPDDTMGMASDVFTLITLCAWLKVTNITLSLGVLRPGGQNRSCVYIDTFGMWFVSIPLTYLAAFHWQLSLFWVVAVAYSEDLTKLALYLNKVWQRKWLKNLS